MSTEFPHQPAEPVNPPPAQAFPPPAPTGQQAEAVDWAPPPWPPAPTEQIPSYDGAPPAKPPATPVRRPDNAPFVNQDDVPERVVLRGRTWWWLTPFHLGLGILLGCIAVDYALNG
jgi:hypothetical protein